MLLYYGLEDRLSEEKLVLYTFSKTCFCNKCTNDFLAYLTYITKIKNTHHSSVLRLDVPKTNRIVIRILIRFKNCAKILTYRNDYKLQNY